MQPIKLPEAISFLAPWVERFGEPDEVSTLERVSSSATKDELRELSSLARAMLDGRMVSISEAFASTAKIEDPDIQLRTVALLNVILPQKGG